MVEPTIEDARRMQMLSAAARSYRPASAPSSAARPKDRQVTGKQVEATGKKKGTSSSQREKKVVAVKDTSRHGQQRVEERSSASRHPSHPSSSFQSLSRSMPAKSPWSLHEKEKLWRQSVPLSEDAMAQDGGRKNYQTPWLHSTSADEEFLHRASGSFMQREVACSSCCALTLLD